MGRLRGGLHLFHSQVTQQRKVPTMKMLIRGSAVMFATAVILLAFTAPAFAWGKVTICHATASQTNPYVRETVAVDSLDNGHGVHGINAGDIVPPFHGRSGNYPGHNWDATGQNIWNNGCQVPVVTTTTTVEPTTTTTVEPTTTTVEPTTTTTEPRQCLIPEGCATTTTTVEPTTTTTADISTAVSVTSPPSTPKLAAARTLPVTGGDPGVLPGLGFGMLAVGALALGAVVRRRA